MGLALDEPRKSDSQFAVDGMTFLVDDAESNDVMRRGGIVVDHRTGWWGSSFIVSPAYGACC